MYHLRRPTTLAVSYTHLDYDGNGHSDLVSYVYSGTQHNSMVLGEEGALGPWDFAQPENTVQLLGLVNPFGLTGLSVDLTGDGLSLIHI